jgi:hypothetical protein
LVFNSAEVPTAVLKLPVGWVGERRETHGRVFLSACVGKEGLLTDGRVEDAVRILTKSRRTDGCVDLTGRVVKKSRHADGRVVRAGGVE